MKFFKSGFSLAEILIALAIVAVIATMGFTISKKGIERAYNLYIYTGYAGIIDAIADANGNDKFIEYNNIKNCDFTTHIADLFSATSITGNATTATITAPNNIQYTISRFGAQIAEDGSTKYYYRIRMVVPTKKTKDSVNNYIDMMYMPQDHYGLPIVYNSNIANFSERRDLLPFYIDDGVVGRTIKNASGNYTYVKRQYYSMNDALCKVYGQIKALSTNLNSCTGVSGSKEGVVRLGNPQKV